jgi:hypothetical protein
VKVVGLLCRTQKRKGRGFAIATAMGDFGVDKKLQVRKRQGVARGGRVVVAAGSGMWGSIRAFRPYQCPSAVEPLQK